MDDTEITLDGQAHVDRDGKPLCNQGGEGLRLCSKTDFYKLTADQQCQQCHQKLYEQSVLYKILSEDPKKLAADWLWEESLEDTADICKEYFNHKDNNEYVKRRVKFHRRWEMAQIWIRERITENSALSIELRDSYLKDWSKYREGLYNWVKTAKHSGKLDEDEYLELASLRNRLLNQLIAFFNAEKTSGKNLQTTPESHRETPGGGAEGGRMNKRRHTSRKKKKNASQLKIQAREQLAGKIVNKIGDDIRLTKLAEELGCSPPTASRTKVWGELMQRREGASTDVPDGFKHDRESSGPDITSTADAAKAEHYDIKEMMEDSYANSKAPPTTKAVMDRLALEDEKEAERLIRETESFFPELSELSE